MPVEEEEVRILSFSKEWKKLNDKYFYTFRFKRKDKDWEVLEFVQIYINSRSPKRRFFCYAVIFEKESFWANQITNDIAIEDGFKNKEEWLGWMRETYGDRIDREKMNRLKLYKPW